MEFTRKAEYFFNQLQYCLAVEPETLVDGEKGFYSLMLKPEIFAQLIYEYQIDYPFQAENKIIELKVLMNSENISIADALRIIHNFKNEYWFFNSVVMFEPVLENLKRAFKSIKPQITEKELNVELLNYQKYLQAKRESIYINLVNEIQGLPVAIEQTATKTDKLNTSIDAPQFDTKNLRPPTKAIRFSEQLVQEKLLKALSGCFDDSDATALEKAFDGNILTEPLLFPHNQNKLVEVFRRAKYNGLIVSTPAEIKNWLCSNFTFRFTKGTATAVKELNPSTVHDILTKGRGEPSKGERICVADWLPYKSPIQLKQASQNEKTKKT